MSPLNRLIHEIHRRSLWQVLGIFLAASWGVIEVVDLLTEQVGLPDWTPTMAMVLLLLGLPVVLATAFIQEGMPGQEARADPPVQDGPAVAADRATPTDPTAGARSPDPPSRRSAPRRLLTWRNALLGGLGAFTLLGMSLMVYFVIWADADDRGGERVRQAQARIAALGG